MKMKNILLAALVIIVLTTATIVYFAVEQEKKNSPASYSIEISPLKLTLKKVSISALFEESSKTVSEYQVDVWSFLERTDSIAISDQNNVTMGGFQLLTSKGERIPYAGTVYQTIYTMKNVPLEYKLGNRMDFSQNARLLRHSLIINAGFLHELSNFSIEIFLDLTNKNKESEPFQFKNIMLPIK